MKKFIYMSISLIMVNTVALAQLEPYPIEVANFTGGQVTVGSTIYCYEYQVNTADPNNIAITCDPQDTGITPPKIVVPPGGLVVTLPVPTKPPPNNGYAWVMSDNNESEHPMIAFGRDGTYAVVNGITYPSTSYWGSDGTYVWPLPTSYCGGSYYTGFFLDPGLACENTLT